MINLTDILNARILIVDDLEDNIQLLARMLDAAGYTAVSSTVSATEVCALHRLHRYDLILLDLGMPEMDGFQVMAGLKELETEGYLPVLVITAQPDLKLRALQAGAGDFISKPLQRAEVLVRVHNLLKVRLLHQQLLDYTDVLEQRVRERTAAIGAEIEERKQLEEKLRDHAETLEAKVHDRTKELEDANDELKILNRELVSRRQEAEEARQLADAATLAKSDFLANMSHELRTPLSSIIGFSEVLQDELIGPLNPAQREDVQYILGAGRHQLSLIDDILDFSKVEAGKMALELSRFSMPGVIEKAVVMLRERAVKRRIALTFTLDPEMVPEVVADRRKLKQILLNLLSNAIKFTPDGGAVTVTARDLPAAAGLEIRVTDTGIGIKEEDLPRLFHAFTQLQTPYTKKYQGTGLGLALTKKLVELHGGRIWVTSVFAQGSTFAFTLPRPAPPPTSASR